MDGLPWLDLGVSHLALRVWRAGSLRPIGDLSFAIQLTCELGWLTGHNSFWRF